VLSHELVLERQLLAYGRTHCFGDTDSTRRGEPLQSGGDVDTIAIDIVSVDDDLAEIDAKSKQDPAFFGQVRILFAQGFLDCHCGLECFADGAEIREHGIARVVHDPPPVGRNRLGDDIEISTESPMRTFLVFAGQPAISRYIGINDGGELTG
jgi:hypothetical protein